MTEPASLPTNLATSAPRPKPRQFRRSNKQNASVSIRTSTNTHASANQKGNSINILEAQHKKKESQFKIFLSNVHTLLTTNELKEACQATLLPFVKVSHVHIIHYGPKSTGKAWILIEANDNSPSASESAVDPPMLSVDLTPEGALFAAKKLNGLVIREQLIEATLENKNREERRVKKERNRQQKKPTLPFQNELNQLQGKFKDLEVQIVKEEPPAELKINIRPSDPDFPFDMDKLQLHIIMPELYPEEPCNITVLNEDLPDKIKQQIAENTLKRAQVAYKNKPMLMGLLRWLDNNLEKLLTNKTITNDFKLQQQGIQMLTPKELAATLVIKNTDNNNNNDHQSKEEQESDQSSSNSDSDNDTSDSDNNDHSDDNEEEEERMITANNNGYATTTAHRGTQITCEGLKLLNIGILECHQIHLVVMCSRCRRQEEVTLSPLSPSVDADIIMGHNHNNNSGGGGAPTRFAEECGQCHQALIVEFRKEPMHDASAVMGYLDLEGCQPFDLLPSNFKASCLECSAQDVLFKKVSFGGMETSQNCLNCHKKLSFSISNGRFRKIRASAGKLSAAALEKSLTIKKKPKIRDPNMVGIKVGTPLPDFGACKHYKKSHRWFRFPCCGRAFPCDICHQDNNKDAHEMVLANRMLCGYCSREQTISDKPCKCGADLTGSKNLHNFWEGGKGCRDVKKLSKKDVHKFRGVNKTQSQKEKRVGPKKQPSSTT